MTQAHLSFPSRLRKSPVLLGLLVALSLTACDPAFQQDYIFHNRSGHDVIILTLIDVAETYSEVPGGEPPMQSYFENLEGITIHDGEERSIHARGGLGVACKDGTVDELQRFVYGDSVRFLFDDGRYLDFAWDKWVPNSPYIENNYSFHATDDNAYGRSTYTLQADDYARALVP